MGETTLQCEHRSLGSPDGERRTSEAMILQVVRLEVQLRTEERPHTMISKPSAHPRHPPRTDGRRRLDGAQARFDVAILRCAQGKDQVAVGRERGEGKRSAADGVREQVRRVGDLPGAVLLLRTRGAPYAIVVPRDPERA
jgi:hypothetical protein